MGIKAVFASIGHFFEHLFGKQELQDFAKASEGLLKSALGKIALEAVTEAEQTMAGAAGGDKHAFALAKIEADAEAAGIQVKNSIINLLIELCVSKINGALQGAI